MNDVDVGGADLQVTLTAANGALTLSQVAGLSFSAGEGTADATMTFSGTQTNINAALAGMKFIPTDDYNGPASVTIVTNDLGSTGSGGAQTTGSDTVIITCLFYTSDAVDALLAVDLANGHTILVL